MNRHFSLAQKFCAYKRKQMSLLAESSYKTSALGRHIKNTLITDRRSGGEMQRFFREHGGIRLRVEAADGAELPEEMVQALSLIIQQPRPPALGNSRYQKAGVVPPSTVNKNQADRERRARLKGTPDAVAKAAERNRLARERRAEEKAAKLAAGILPKKRGRPRKNPPAPETVEKSTE